MRYDEFNGNTNEATFANRLKSDFNKAKNFVKSKLTKSPPPSVWKNARNPDAPAATSPQDAAPAPTDYSQQVTPQASATPQGRLAGDTKGGFLSGFAKGVGDTQLAQDFENYKSSKVGKNVTAADNFPFPSSIPAADANVTQEPNQVAEPIAEPPTTKKMSKSVASKKTTPSATTRKRKSAQTPTTTTAGANAFGQMAKSVTGGEPKPSATIRKDGQTWQLVQGTGNAGDVQYYNPATREVKSIHDLQSSPTAVTAPSTPNTTPTSTVANNIPNVNFGLKNLPQKAPTPNYGRGQQNVAPSNVSYNMPAAKKPIQQQPAPVSENMDLAEVLWRKMKNKR